MKKKAGHNNEAAVRASEQGKMAVEKLKYEVGQEMGISSKTKNKKS